MALVSGTIRNLFGGVSQAPPEQRSDSQFEELVNVFPRAGLKLQRRPPLKHVAQLSAADLTGAFTHQLGDYTLVVTDAGAVHVFNTRLGNELALTNTAGSTYVTPGSALRAVTVGNTAYIVNTSVSPAKGGAAAGVPSFRAHVTVRAGDYETKYTVVLDSTAFTYTTPAQATAGSKAAIATDAIALSLKGLITAGGVYSCTNIGSTLAIHRVNGADFTCITYDGLSDQGLSLAKDSIKQFSDLPPRAEWGTVLKVRGESPTAVDDYYMRTVASDGGTGPGDSWEEVTQPGSQYTLDPSTMPVRLVITGPSTATLEECPWVDRKAGDDTTVPFPSFLGKTIADIFVHEGRLGFITDGDKIVLSEAGNFFNLFRTTATQILSSDPIDVSGSISGIVSIDFAVNWNETVYLFANGRSQYRLDSAGGPLTASTISITHKSEYRYDPSVRPTVTGSRMFFVTNEGGSQHVVDYHLRGYERVHTADDTGSQVPTYLLNPIIKLEADDTRGVLFAVTSHLVYVYNYRYDNDERVQGAWSRWEFQSGTILGVTIVDGVLTFVWTYSDGAYLNTMALDRPSVSMTQDGTLVFPADTSGDSAYLDRVFTTTSSTFDGTYTTYTLPYSVAVNGSEGLIGLVFFDGRATQIVDRPSPTTVRILGNPGAAVASIGLKYFTTITLSPLFVRDRNGVADLRGRLQLRKLRLQYVGASSIDVSVTIPGRDTTSKLLTSPYPVSGEMVMPLLARNLECGVKIQMSSAGADGLTGITWEGTYTVHATRI